MLSRVVSRVFAGFATHVEPKGGKLLTWGSSGYSLGRVAGSDSYEVPGQVHELDSPITKVSTGKRHVIIQTSKGTLYGAGSNSLGQLASTSNNCDTPQLIQYFNGLKVKSFSSGDYHNIAALEDGTVVVWGAHGCWRLNFLNALFGGGNSLGLGQTYTSKPVVVPGISDVEQVTAGDSFSLALKRDGRVFGWGNVFGGRLLVQSSVVDTPIELVEITRFLNKKHTHIVKICSAGSRTVFLCDNGKLYTFGKSYDGNTGHRPNELINEGDRLDHITPVVDENFKGQAVEDFKISPNGLILRTKQGGVYYSGMGLAYKPKAFPHTVPNVKTIFAAESSVGIISDDNKIYYISDKLIEESDQCPKTKVYISEDERLSGNIQQIGGKYDTKFAIIA